MRTSKTRLLPKVARLALVLLIQCPLPVLHAHGVTAGELSSIPALPEHVRRFHDPREQIAGETLGWHLHVLPPLGTPADQRGDDQEAPDVDLPWRSDTESESPAVQLVCQGTAESADSWRFPSIDAARNSHALRCDSIGEICRRQRQSVLRA